MGSYVTQCSIRVVAAVQAPIKNELSRGFSLISRNEKTALCREVKAGICQQREVMTNLTATCKAGCRVSSKTW